MVQVEVGRAGGRDSVCEEVASRTLESEFKTLFGDWQRIASTRWLENCTSFRLKLLEKSVMLAKNFDRWPNCGLTWPDCGWSKNSPKRWGEPSQASGWDSLEEGWAWSGTKLLPHQASLTNNVAEFIDLTDDVAEFSNAEE